jgi:hypothetical protein
MNKKSLALLVLFHLVAVTSLFVAKAWKLYPDEACGAGHRHRTLQMLQRGLLDYQAEHGQLPQDLSLLHSDENGIYSLGERRLGYLGLVSPDALRYRVVDGKPVLTRRDSGCHDCGTRPSSVTARTAFS